MTLFLSVLPDNIEARSVHVPGLDGGLIVEENDFDKVMEGDSYDGGSFLNGGTRRRRSAFDCVEVEHTGNVEPVSQLQWGV